MHNLGSMFFLRLWIIFLDFGFAKFYLGYLVVSCVCVCRIQAFWCIVSVILYVEVALDNLGGVIRYSFSTFSAPISYQI